MSEETTIATASQESTPAFDIYKAAGERAWKGGEQTEIWRALTKHASQDGFRYNLCGVHVKDGAAIACDGHRALVVSGIAKKTANALYSVTSGRVTLDVLDAQPVDLRVAFGGLNGKPKRYAISNFGKLRKLSLSTPVRLTDNGLLLGSGPSDGLAVNLRYLTQLPFTDEELTIEVRAMGMPILVRPKLGGWIAGIMATRIDGQDTFLREVR